VRRALRGVPAIAGAHHERMDGRGFPQGLVRNQISLQDESLDAAVQRGLSLSNGSPRLA
jgi:hypothetical protein